MEKFIGCGLLPLVDTFGRGIALGVGEYVRVHRDYQVILANWEHLNFWRRPCGVITRIYSEEQLLRAQKLELPVVLTSNSFARAYLPSVLIDDRAVGKMAADYLLRKGFRHLAYVGVGTPGSSQDRFEGFSRRAQEEGLLVRQMSPHDSHLPEFIQELPKPVGILARNDYWARMVLETALSLSIPVPGEVAVVGVDNDEIECHLTAVEITSIKLETKRIGWQACALLEELLAKPVTGPPWPNLLLAPTGIVERASTNTYAIPSPLVQKALRYIAEQASDQIFVPDVVLQCGVSRSTLERRFRELTGKTIREWILEYRLQNAEKLLAESDASIAGIAQTSGFSEYRRFLEAFRRRHGMSPQDYRRKMQEGRRDPVVGRKKQLRLR